MFSDFHFSLNQSYVFPVDIPSVMEHMVELWCVTLCFDGYFITSTFTDHGILQASVFCSNSSIPIFFFFLISNVL
jgi:hypothetical protein